MDLLEARFAPTPLYLLDADERGNRIFIKREDLLPYSFGGNKVRIAMEYLRDLRAKGCDHLVAYGNARSNLCRVLSNLCAGMGLPVTIISPADDDGERRPAFNGRLCEAFGARVVPCQKTGVAETVDAVLADIEAAGGKPYYIYGNRLGTGNEAVPTAAYAGMYHELAEQERAVGASFEAIFLAAGTGMTQAGLLCGQALAGAGARPWRVIGVSTARTADSAREHVLTYADAYLRGRGTSVAPERVEVCGEFREGYGRYGAEVERCMRRAMARYGLPLDGTYTGKAFHGMQTLLARWGWQDKDVLFLHTGGTPLFFDAAQRWGASAPPEGGEPV